MKVTSAERDLGKERRNEELGVYYLSGSRANPKRKEVERKGVIVNGFPRWSQVKPGFLIVFIGGNKMKFAARL